MRVPYPGLPERFHAAPTGEEDVQGGPGGHYRRRQSSSSFPLVTVSLRRRFRVLERATAYWLWSSSELSAITQDRIIGSCSPC